MTLPTALLTPTEMGELDRRTIAGGVAGAVLMERAGAAVVAEIRQRWTRRPVVVLCGPGNNGGDGAALTGDAADHAARWTGGVEQLDLGILAGAGLVVDALFGAGLSRPLGESAAAPLAEAARLRLPIVAIDVPSGLFGATGVAEGAVAANLTLTLRPPQPPPPLPPRPPPPAA